MRKITKQGVVRTGFSVETKELKRVLRIVKSSFKNQTLKLRPYCEITIKTKKIEFAVSGLKYSLKCDAWGPARFIIGFEHFYQLVYDRPLMKTKVVVGDEFMTINERVTVCVQTWRFKKDTILRTIDLPVNYDMIDILNLAEKYTREEIEFNELRGEYLKAHNNLYDKIEKIKRLLKTYKLQDKNVEDAIYKLVLKLK